MPAIVAFFVRQFIIIAVQIGIFAFIERYITPLLNSVIAQIIEVFGVSEETASDILTNEILTTAESLGLTVALSKARLPLMVAEKLKFTSKGFAKRKLTPETEAKIATLKGAGTPIAKPGFFEMSLTNKILGGLLVWNLLTDWNWIAGSLGFLAEDQRNDIQKRALSILNLINAARNIVYSAEKNRRQLSQQERALIKQSADEAQKQIADIVATYEKKFVLFGRKDVTQQMINSTTALTLELESLRQTAGLIPRQPLRKDVIEAVVAVVFDGDTLKLDNGETVRFVGIDAPESTTEAGEKSKKYLKERLEGKTIKIESDPDALIDIYGRRLGVVYLNTININIEMLQKGLAEFYEFAPNALVFKKQWVAATKEVVSKEVSLAVPKVFSGIVTQGTLGATATFEARQVDLISTVDDLKAAAQNNLASFIVTLPGRIVYEIKIVSSVTSKDGFVQRGTTRQIVTGYSKEGKPRYKTVFNRFAIVNIYAVTEKGAKTKLANITLGPTDSAKLQPSGLQLSDIEASVKKDIFTSNINDITNIKTSTPITVAPQEPQPLAAAILGQITPLPSVGATIAPVVAPVGLLKLNVSALTKIAQERSTGFNYRFQDGTVIPAGRNPEQAATIDVAGILSGKIASDIPKEFLDAARGTIEPLVSPPISATCAATTLFEFYSARGQKLPTVEERSKIYASLSLGVEAYYTGTAEQNIKLLSELKRQAGCQ